MSHLVLVGLMGAGKTTVGQVCADRLGRAFVDTDDLVRIATGRTIPELFAERGEDGFRAAERDAVADACASPAPLVIACGGGAVVDAENRRSIASTGFVVWLQASPAVLADRVEADGTERPLLAPRGATATLERLSIARSAAYEAAADAVVDTEGLDVSAVADAVLEVFRSQSRDAP